MATIDRTYTFNAGSFSESVEAVEEVGEAVRSIVGGEVLEIAHWYAEGNAFYAGYEGHGVVGMFDGVEGDVCVDVHGENPAGVLEAIDSSLRSRLEGLTEFAGIKDNPLKTLTFRDYVPSS